MPAPPAINVSNTAGMAKKDSSVPANKSRPHFRRWVPRWRDQSKIRQDQFIGLRA